jgi:ATP phosphoribosyltransferase-like protein
VRIVAAAPAAILEEGKLPRRPLVVASEYERLTQSWIRERELDARFVRSYGATEVFPPEDADCIVDNAATGSTLRDNALEVVDELMRSSTRLYAHPRALEDKTKRGMIDELELLLGSVLAARKRVMVEVNVTAEALERVIAALPCMRQPTIATLHGDSGYAVKAAVPREQLPMLVCELKARGATDIVVSKLAQIVA